MKDYLWQLYELQTESLFRRVSGATVDRDVRELGVDSKRLRQIDVRVTLHLKVELPGNFELSVPIKIVVDCKHHGRRLDLPTLGTVIGLKQDLRANLAIVICPLGVSDGVANMAAASHVVPLVVTQDLIAQMYGPEDDALCQICDGFPNEIYWKTFGAWTQSPPLEGSCEYCAQLHVCCPDCFTIFAVTTSEPQSCPNDCGSVFTFDGDRKSQEVWLDQVYHALDVKILSELSKRRRKRMTEGRVDALIQKTRWQHWMVGSPLIGLTEAWLVEWSDNGDELRLTEDGQELVDHVLAVANPADWFNSNLSLGRQLQKMLGDQRGSGS